jgi:transcriptional regulator with GAF, ATPase, and Fis domain
MGHLLRRYIDGASITTELGSRMVLIGSSPENDIVVKDGSPGGVAAKIEPVSMAGDAYTIEPVHKGSVRLNGKKVGKTALQPGDRMEIGTSVMVYDVLSAADRSPESSPLLGSSIEAFNGFIESVGTERDLRKLLVRLMEILLKLLNGSDVFIFKLDGEGKPQLFVSTGNDVSDERFSDTVVQKVLHDKQGIVIAHALADPAFSKSRSIADLKLASVVCAPIMVAGSIIGIVYVGSRKIAVSFSGKELSVLSFYAAIAGMLINHVEYIGQQVKTIKNLTGRNELDDGFIAESRAMQRVAAEIKSLAASDIVVLLEGPTGSGKNHVAEIIHRKSRRASKPFLIVNCSSLRGELLESELFGHKKGSFTGAVSDQTGLFSAARGGTLLLDEIGELDLIIQAKLLRVLESGSIRPLGATGETAVDVRVICATNRNLAEMVQNNTFRRDLYYRINQFSIRIPALSEREEDVVLLAYLFLEKYKAHYPGRAIVDFHPSALRFIRNHDWPGNIRELSNAIHRALLSGEGPLLTLEDPGSERPADPVFDFEAATQKFQKELILKAIKHSGGNKEEAAKLLGLSRSTFFRYQASCGGK